MEKLTWGSHELKPDGELNLNLGELGVSIRGESDELWISSHRENQPTEIQTEGPEWSRWALKSKPKSVSLRPVFPDKSIVVKPERPFVLRPSVEAKIYVRVPLWLAIRANEKDEEALSEIPSVHLSLTWFGTPMEGELCYWISSSARREIVTDSDRDYLAICPMLLKNDSDTDLLVQKLCLRVKWLSLYLSKGQLWANLTRINYRGGEDMSQISVVNGPPGESGKSKLVSSPREVLRKSFSMRTFFAWGADELTRGVETEAS